MKNKIIKQLVVNAMFIALLVVSSFISIPVNQVPYTLQTLLVFIILAIIGLVFTSLYIQWNIIEFVQIKIHTIHFI